MTTKLGYPVGWGLLFLSIYTIGPEIGDTRLDCTRLDIDWTLDTAKLNCKTQTQTV